MCKLCLISFEARNIQNISIIYNVLNHISADINLEKTFLCHCCEQQDHKDECSTGYQTIILGFWLVILGQRSFKSTFGAKNGHYTAQRAEVRSVSSY